METSKNFGFFLPSTSTDDIANIDRISENFLTIDYLVPTRAEVQKSIENAISEQLANFIDVSEVGM